MALLHEKERFYFRQDLYIQSTFRLLGVDCNFLIYRLLCIL